MAKADWTATGWRIFEDAAEFTKDAAYAVSRDAITIPVQSVLRLEGPKGHGYLDIPGLTAAEVMEGAHAQV